MNTVLVADDEPKIRKFLGAVLENEDFKVLEAANGQECIEMYHAHCPEAVLIDIVMPEKDGIAAIREIKKINPRARIIAMSGGLVFTPQTYLDEAALAGAQCTLSKPIDRRQLICAINSLFISD